MSRAPAPRAVLHIQHALSGVLRHHAGQYELDLVVDHLGNGEHVAATQPLVDVFQRVLSATVGDGLRHERRDGGPERAGGLLRC